MAMVLDCAHGTGDCGFVAEGDTAEEVVQMLAAHVKNEHDVAITPTLVAELRNGVRET